VDVFSPGGARSGDPGGRSCSHLDSGSHLDSFSYVDPVFSNVDPGGDTRREARPG
jgi:hypothetical protein